MNDIEKEIVELEELIRLQRMKCDLLHRKNCAMSTPSVSSPPISISSMETTNEKKDDDTNETVNVLHAKTNSTSEISHVATLVADNVRRMAMSTTEFKTEDIPRVVKKETDDTPVKESKLIAAESTPVETKEDRFVNAITRLSRLNTDLANERNLLAWARTALASARTFLAFVGVTAVTDFGKASRQICYLGFAVMSIYIILQGTERYNKIKRIVYLKNPPPNFDRLTNAPLPICLAILFCLGLMSISFDQWED